MYENAVFIASLAWPVFGLFAIGMLVNPSFYQSAYKDFVKGSGMILIGGLANLIIGLLIVMSYREWVADWTVIITLIGYLSLLKAAMMLVLPDMFLDLVKPLINSKNFGTLGAAISAIFALIMIYGIYFA